MCYTCAVQSPAAANTVTLEFAFNIVSFLVGIAVSGFSVWLAIHFKREADRVNERTQDVLMEVKTDAKVSATFAAGEAKSWGDVGRRIALGSTFSGTSVNIDTGGAGTTVGAPSPAAVVPLVPAQGEGSESHR